jgi:hypothetical protein
LIRRALRNRVPLFILRLFMLVWWKCNEITKEKEFWYKIIINAIEVREITKNACGKYMYFIGVYLSTLVLNEDIMLIARESSFTGVEICSEGHSSISNTQTSHVSIVFSLLSLF